MKTNYHTHTTFCDGKASVEDNVVAAISKGFDILGFSAHSMLPFSSDWHIASRCVADYIREVKSAAKKYKDKITILCGFEADYLPPFTTPNIDQYNNIASAALSQLRNGKNDDQKPSPYCDCDSNIDYLIGSVHYIVNDKGYFTADGKPLEIINGLKNYWGGDARAAICEYYAAQRAMLKSGKFTIWAHPDVIRRRNDTLKFFDESDTWYKDEVMATVKVAKAAGVIAELNTGGWARGNIQDIYPSKYFLSLLHNFNIPIIISSDAHDPSLLDFGLDEAKQKARDAGYKEVVYIDIGGEIRFDTI